MNDLDGMEEIIDEFLTEAFDNLEFLAENIIDLEQKRDDKELLDTIFRNIHTLKGSAGFLGLDPVALLAHKVEDILNKFRKNEIVIDSISVDIILESIDYLDKMLTAVKKSEKVEKAPEKLFDKLSEISEKEKSSDKEVLKDSNFQFQLVEEQDSKEVVEFDNSIFEGESGELINDFIIETDELLEKLDISLIDLSEKPGDLDILNEIFRYVHTIKGTGSFLGFDQLTSMTHVAEDLLNLLRKNELTLTDEIMDELLKFNDMLKILLGDIADKNIIKRDIEYIVQNLVALKDGEKVTKQKEIILASPPEEIKTVNGENEIKAPEPKEEIDQTGDRKKNSADHTIRVDVRRLENLLNLVGELVLTRNKLQKVTETILQYYDENDLLEKLVNVNSEISHISSNIQSAVMKTRMTPIGKVFNKFPRLVRDLARQTGKEIELIIEGAETELDRTLVEEISDPLVHLIRNSCDHGVELPKKRVESGKPAKGFVKIFAKQEGDSIIIGISDDGNGIDPKIILKKAIEKGIVNEQDGKKLSDKDIVNLIFAAGFSTAEKVSNISGRGVGMDVVKTNIAKLNGVIEIDSIPGQGSTFFIRLPLTLAIIKVLMIEIGSEVLAIPINSVVEITNLTDGIVKKVNQKDMFILRDQVYPLVWLDRIFKYSSENKGLGKYVIIVISGEKKYGFVVDSINEGQAEIVIKQLGDFMPHVSGIAGGTITGDGRIRLIIDVQEVVQIDSGVLR